MGLIAQLILGGVVLAALGGAWWSHNNAQQEIGKAEIRAELEKQQKETEAANAMRALEGEKYALDLLAKAERRVKQQAAQIKELAATRKAQDDERAKVDPEFRDWGVTPVPLYADNRLRQRANALAATADRGGVSGASGVEVGPASAGDTDAPVESWVTRLRRRAAGLVGSGVERSGPGSGSVP